MADFDAEKIKNILSNPQAAEMIANLVSSMSTNGSVPPVISDFSEKLPEPTEAPPEPASAEALAAPTDVSSESISAALPAVSSLLSGASYGQDKRIALLKAIKPYVSDSKKERVDGLVRAIGVAGILNTYKNGLFG